MGWAKAPSIQFDHMILKDEAAEKALLIQLLDRNLVSEEMVVEKFGATPELETARKKREKRETESGKRVGKTGPYDKDKIHELVKIALGRGFIGPEQAGIDIDEEIQEKEREQQPPVQPSPQNNGTDSPAGKSGEGRPKNSKDSPGTNRDRQFKPRTSAEIADDIGAFLNSMSVAKKHQAEIGSIILPGILRHYGKKNTRSLSSQEFAQTENTKFLILSNLPKGVTPNKHNVAEILSGQPTTSQQFKKCYNILLSSFIKKISRQPNIEEVRNIQAATYVICS